MSIIESTAAAESEPAAKMAAVTVRLSVATQGRPGLVSGVCSEYVHVSHSRSFSHGNKEHSLEWITRTIESCVKQLQVL